MAGEVLQGKTSILKDEFWWLSGWQNLPTHRVAGLFELYEQLLPTMLYASQKMGKDLMGAVTCSFVIKLQRVPPLSWPVVPPWLKINTSPDIMQP